MASLLAYGAGSGEGLDEALKNEILKERMAEEIRHNQATESDARQTHADYAQSRKDLAEEKRQQGIERAASGLGIGDEIAPADYQKYIGADVPPSQFKVTPGKQVQSTIGLMTLPGNGPVTSATRTTTDASSPLNAPKSILNLGTQSQRQAAQENSSKDAQREANIQRATDAVQQAWERIRLQGENQDNKNSLALAAQELSRVRAEAASSAADMRNQLTQAKIDQANNAGSAAYGSPIIAEDGKGGYVVHTLHKDGTLTSQPLPAGQTPTKAAGPGFLDSIKRIFGGGVPAPAPISADPNWGQQ